MDAFIQSIQDNDSRLLDKRDKWLSFIQHRFKKLTGFEFQPELSKYYSLKNQAYIENQRKIFEKTYNYETTK